MTSISVAVQGALGSACRLIHMCAQAAPSESHEAHVPTSRRSLREGHLRRIRRFGPWQHNEQSPRGAQHPGPFVPGGGRTHLHTSAGMQGGVRGERCGTVRAARRLDAPRALRCPRRYTNGTRRYTILPQLTTPPKGQRERHFKGALRRPLFERRSWLRVLSTTCRPQGVARCWRRETRARGPACGLTRIAHALAATGTVLARPAPSTDGPARRCA
jgi:hypothetical protein